MGLDWLHGPGLSSSFTVFFFSSKRDAHETLGLCDVKLFVLSLSEVTHIGKV